MTVITRPLAAARNVERLLTAAKERLVDAESEARDGRLTSIAQWIRARIGSLDAQLLKEARATVDVLERRQAKEIEALETAHRAAASGLSQSSPARRGISTCSPISPRDPEAAMEADRISRRHVEPLRRER